MGMRDDIGSGPRRSLRVSGEIAGAVVCETVYKA